jgi:hypothetical protein
MWHNVLWIMDMAAEHKCAHRALTTFSGVPADRPQPIATGVARAKTVD